MEVPKELQEVPTALNPSHMPGATALDESGQDESGWKEPDGQACQPEIQEGQQVDWVLALCGAVRCCAVLCCAVLCCAVLCCAVLCCAVLCCAVLCCAVLCCAVLCCAVLCCAVLCSAVLYCAGLHTWADAVHAHNATNSLKPCANCDDCCSIINSA